LAMNNLSAGWGCCGSLIDLGRALSAS